MLFQEMYSCVHMIGCHCSDSFYFCVYLKNILWKGIRIIDGKVVFVCPFGQQAVLTVTVLSCVEEK
jgi:hypothetical protein